MTNIKKVIGPISRNIVWLIVALEFLLFGILSDTFFNVHNIMTVFRQVSIICIMACGTATVMIGGNLDLSNGPIASLICYMAAYLGTELGLPIWLCILISLIIGTAIGFINGTIVTKTKMPPMLATMGMGMVINGVSLLISNSEPIYNLVPKDGWQAIEKTRLFGLVPISVLYMIVIVLITWFILNKVFFGRYVYATGSNDDAAFLSGIKVNKIRVITYMLSGITAAFGGVLLTSRLNSGQPQGALNMENDVLCALVVAGISFHGGKGNVINTIAGALVVGVLTNGLVNIGLTEFYQKILQGLVLIVAVGFDSYRNNKSAVS